jgi:hypothetical protein
VSTKSGDVNKMVIPAVLPKPRNVVPRSATADDDEDADGYGAGGGAGNAGKSCGVVFKLLSRDSKGRFETRQMQVRALAVCFCAVHAKKCVGNVKPAVPQHRRYFHIAQHSLRDEFARVENIIFVFGELLSMTLALFFSL